MISLHSMLAAAESSSESTGGNILIPVAIIAAVALIVIAFFVGFKKGIRRVGWKGLTWILSGGLFLVLKGVIAPDGDQIMTIVTAVACAVIGMVLYNVCSWIFRPKMKYRRLKNFKQRNKADDLEYEADYSEYDSMVARDYVAISQGMKPGFLERVFGGVASIFNLFAVIIGIALAALTFVGMTDLVDLSSLNEYLAIGTDFALIGFMIVLGCVGFERGFFGGIRWIFVTFASLLALALGMGVAFIFGAEEGGIEAVVNIVKMINEYFAPLGDMSYMLSQVVVGAVLFIPMLIVVALLNYILGLLVRGIRGTKPTRLVDGLIGTIVLILIAVVLSVLIIGVCYILQEKAIVFNNVSNYLSNTDLGNSYLWVWVENIHEMLPL